MSTIIFLPVNPESPAGPPITNLPVATFDETVEHVYAISRVKNENNGFTLTIFIDGSEIGIANSTVSFYDDSNKGIFVKNNQSGSAITVSSSYDSYTELSEVYGIENAIDVAELKRDALMALGGERTYAAVNGDEWPIDVANGSAYLSGGTLDLTASHGLTFKMKANGWGNKDYVFRIDLGGTNIDLENIDFTGAEERLAEFETADWMKTLDEYVSQAKAASVEMDLLRAQVEVYEQKYDIAKADSYLKPAVGMQVQAGFSGTAFPFLERGWYTSGSPILSASIGIQSRILDGGDRLSTIMLGEQELQNAKYQLQSGEFTIESTVSTLYSNIEYNYTNIAYLKDQEANYQRLADRQRIRYNAGQLREIDYLRSLIEYQTSLISTANERITLVGNYFQLMYLIDNVDGKDEPIVTEEVVDGTASVETDSQADAENAAEPAAEAVPENTEAAGSTAETVPENEQTAAAETPAAQAE